MKENNKKTKRCPFCHAIIDINAETCPFCHRTLIEYSDYSGLESQINNNHIINESNSLRDKYINLFSYLKEFVSLSEKTVRNFEEYEDFIWFKDIQNDYGNYSILWQDGSKDNPEWIRFKKPKEPNFPNPPERLLRWIEQITIKNYKTIPNLKNEIQEDDIVYYLKDYPELKNLFDNYLNNEWLVWASVYEEFEKKQNNYQKFYNMYQKSIKFGEEFELIIGLGLMYFRTDKGLIIKRHILAANALLDFRPEKGLFDLTIGAEGAKLKIEDQMIEGLQEFSGLVDSVKELEEELDDKDLLETPFDEEIKDCLKSFLNKISPNADFIDDIAISTQIPAKPTIFYAPAVILRKRNRKSFSALFQAILENLQNHGDINIETLNDLFIFPENNKFKEKLFNSEDFEEIYFPKPSNEEQRKILYSLNKNNKVLVQGPPGTGKSHTIANLISHLLASGNKILITAYTKRALEVLKGQLPEDIKPLCVNLLGNDKESIKDLEISVQDIIGRLNSFDQNYNLQDLKKTEIELKNAKRKKAEIDTKLVGIKEIDSREQVFNEKYRGKIIEIAKKINDEQDKYGWFKDPVNEIEKLPEIIQTAKKFINIYKEFEADNVDIDLRKELPTDFDFIPEKEFEFYAKMKNPSTFDESKINKFKWSKKAFNDCMMDSSENWEFIYKKTTSLLTQEFKERVDSYEKDYKIEYPNTISKQKLKSDAKFLRDYVSRGGNFGGIKLFKPREVKERLYVTKDVLVNENNCKSKEDLEALVNHLEIESVFDYLLNDIWQGYVEKKSIYSLQLLEFEKNKDELESIVVISKDFGKLEDKILNELNYLKTFKRQEKSNCHKITDEIINAIENNNFELYDTKLRELEYLKLLYVLKHSYPSLLNYILTSKIEHFNDEDLKSAILWKHAKDFLEEFISKDHSTKLESDFKETSEKISKLTSKLVSLKAWESIFENTDYEQKMNLIAWALAVKKIGKGTGKNAWKFRKEAQSRMNKCRTAVPAWIMPIYRIAETIEPEPGMFDYVIIDEASQAGPEALFLLFLAKKIVIVGDDKQIAPEFIGMEKDTVQQLIDKYLDDNPFKNFYNPEFSFFAHAELFCISRYGKITLREHFRCMPEIIEFSNKNFYAPFGTPLFPMRQYSEKRLDPLKEVYVKDGSAEGQSPNIINRAEADEIVNTIEKCIGDKMYDGKTFGVITLLGNAQAKYIENLLLNKIGPEEMEKRKLVCGNSSSFQGDERDVIFLSMVVSRSSNFRALTVEADQRRFNVAASRARDQMWLFHSVALEDLTNKEDMRFSLLQYFYLQKQHKPEQYKIIQVQEDGKLPEPFESWFEFEVYNRIIQKGYEVIPQYKVNNFRIDLAVILSNGTKIAVECDGDKFHDKEQYKNDMLRQRALERCGWQFFRIRGCEYYSDPVKSLIPLWDLLERNNNLIIEQPIVDNKINVDEDISVEEKPETYESETQEQKISEEESIVEDLSNEIKEENIAQENIDIRDVEKKDNTIVEKEKAQDIRSQTRKEIYEAIILLKKAFPFNDEEIYEAITQMQKVHPINDKEIYAICLEASRRLDELDEPPPDLYYYLRSIYFENNYEINGDNLNSNYMPSSKDDGSWFKGIDKDIWFKIAHWGKIKNTLPYWQRKLAYRLGVYSAQGKTPSEKQLYYGKVILKKYEESKE